MSCDDGPAPFPALFDPARIEIVSATREIGRLSSWPCYTVKTKVFYLQAHRKGEALMFRLLIHWLLSAIALLLVSRIVPGFFVTGLQSALIAALVIGFLNATLGFLLKLITFPIAIITFGLFLLVINAAMILFASHLVGGFTVYGWVPAFWGAVVLSVLGLIIRAFSNE
jgi:putative membrane protein